MAIKYRTEVDAINKEKAVDICSGLPIYVMEFILSYSNHGNSEGTSKTYAYDLRAFFYYLTEIDRFADKKIIELTVEDIRTVTPKEIESYISNSGVRCNPSANTKARRLASIRSFYTFLVKNHEYDIDKNPALLVKNYEVKQKQVIKLDQDEVQTLIDVIQTGEHIDDNGKVLEGLTKRQKAFKKNIEKRDLAIIMTLLGTGLRISELVGLDVTDFDIKHGCFHVVRKGMDEDVAYFGEQVEKYVASYIESERKQVIDSISEKSSSNIDKDALFLSIRGTRMSVRAIELMVKKYAKLAHLGDNITPHKFRATYATFIYQETQDVYMVKDALHHKALATSQKYIGDVNGRKRKAAKITNSLLDG